LFDAINGAFEAFASVFVFLSILRLYRDRSVKGVSPIGVAFFASWGYWNLIYYPHLNQWWSTVAAGLVAVLNTIWCIGLFYYGRNRVS
jgi:hypothetical protein